MLKHEPDCYVCPFCQLLVTGVDKHGITTQRDIVRCDELATAFISPRWWPNNQAHVIVVPNAHYENLYDLPSRYGHAVHDLVREVAKAVKQVYQCDGTSVRQHNEPAGSQDVWHYHVHTFPRYAGDGFDGTCPYREFVTEEQRLPYAEKLRSYFEATTAG